MKAFVVFCALVAIAHGASMNRIVGGENAKPGQFKHQVSLRSRDDFHFCGATIIGPRTLATAAHCKVYPEDYTVAVVGTTLLEDRDARRYNIESFIIHEDYNSATITNDVAVVILTEDIDMSDPNVGRLELSTSAPVTGERLTSSGWGYTTYPGSAPNNLQWMQMNVVSPDACYAETGMELSGKICTLEVAGKGVCSGDSGGPLVNARGELAGITSAAYLCALGKPDFFTDVHYFRDWISKRVV